MLSGQIGRYRYYEIEDMYQSVGCLECHSLVAWRNGLFPEQQKDQHEVCLACPIFRAVKLTKLYAQQLAEYEERYLDDGR